MPFAEEFITADIPDTMPSARLPVVPVAASVGLHALLGLLFLALEPGSGDQDDTPERTYITVTLQKKTAGTGSRPAGTSRTWGSNAIFTRFGGSRSNPKRC
jgi:hypothetical protein